jgi:hypothetical protein
LHHRPYLTKLILYVQRLTLLDVNLKGSFWDQLLTLGERFVLCMLKE